MGQSRSDLFSGLRALFSPENLSQSPEILRCSNGALPSGLIRLNQSVSRDISYGDMDWCFNLLIRMASGCSAIPQCTFDSLTHGDYGRSSSSGGRGPTVTKNRMCNQKIYLVSTIYGQCKKDDMRCNKGKRKIAEPLTLTRVLRVHRPDTFQMLDLYHGTGLLGFDEYDDRRRGTALLSPRSYLAGLTENEKIGNKFERARSKRATSEWCKEEVAKGNNERDIWERDLTFRLCNICKKNENMITRPLWKDVAEISTCFANTIDLFQPGSCNGYFGMA